MIKKIDKLIFFNLLVLKRVYMCVKKEMTSLKKIKIYKLYISYIN